MPDPRPWTCAHCQSEQTHDVYCEMCGSARFRSWDVMVSEHVLEHIADGLSTPRDVQDAMNARPCYARINSGQGFDLQYIVSRIRMLTKDTKSLARQLFEAQAAVMALNVVKHGDTKDHIQALKGIQVLGEVVEHKGEVQTIVKHVYEDAPKRD